MALKMPAARQFGWALKPNSSSHFHIHKRSNGQFAVVLNHALLRGVTADMITWWFANFANLSVRLIDVPSYEEAVVPVYHLWHPTDHYSASLLGQTYPDGTARAGAKIHIREAMQYDTLGWKYAVDQKLEILYIGPDGWAMGKVLPLLGPLMVLRIHFKDVVEGDFHAGVHYHYEIVVGTSIGNFVGRQINKRLTAKFGPEFFEAWHRHNVIEVGTFENFLPSLYAQRANLSDMSYSPVTAKRPPSPSDQSGFSRSLFKRRAQGFQSAHDLYTYQAFAAQSFL
ncbi:MAG: hypothetical protein AAFR60_00265 [Pseudomonadota bacterium]